MNVDKAFFMAVNGAVVVGTAIFCYFFPDPISLMIILSGWTSFGAIVLGDYLAIRAFKVEKEINERQILAKIDKAMTDLEQILNDPVVAQAVANLLLKGLEGGGEDGSR